MGKRLIAILITLGLAASLFGCAQNDNASAVSGDAQQPISSEQTDISEVVPSGSSEAIQSSPTILTPVELTNTYTTKFEEVNAVTYPPFAFDYPDNWTVTAEDVGQQSEKVTLTNDSGAEIFFFYLGIKNPGGESATLMQRVEVSKAAESNFIPGYVQATDYSSLGKFVVAKLKVTGTLEMKKDADFTPFDGGISYAVLPETEIGVHSDVRAVFSLAFSFWYSGNVSFIAKAPDGEFTPQEEQEVLAVLSSFRVQQEQIAVNQTVEKTVPTKVETNKPVTETVVSEATAVEQPKPTTSTTNPIDPASLPPYGDPIYAPEPHDGPEVAPFGNIPGYIYVPGYGYILDEGGGAICTGTAPEPDVCAGGTRPCEGHIGSMG